MRTVVRAVVAMAYPPGNPRAPQRWPYQTVLERVPTGPAHIIPHVLQQGDMPSLDNWIFGDIEAPRRETRADRPGEGIEHCTFPMVKLIDYGQATEYPEPEPGTSTIDDFLLPGDIASFDGVLGLAAITAAEQGAPTIDPRARNEAIEENIKGIGETMMNFFGETRAGLVQFILNLRTQNNPVYDLDLFTLIARCMAQDRRNRPNLAHLLHIVQIATTTRDARFYGRPRERDQHIRTVVQSFILEPGP
ncbi:hypothetical protein GGR57DRAFT_244983 [Xylariaceae sp. FL1272]|nr:hypothetical protein GGR57DRAFT_244983 [Xylariaceae sp. FL1272]